MHIAVLFFISNESSKKMTIYLYAELVFCITLFCKTK